MPGAPTMLVAGATGSIGAAVAQSAHARGWRVVLHGRNTERIDQLALEIAPNGKRIATVALDLNDKDGPERLIAEAAGTTDRLDAVIDCTSRGSAGTVGPFASTKPGAYARMLAVSLGDVERLAHAALPWLKVQGGTFIALASDAGRFAAPNQTIIGAARAGTIGFIRNLSVEVARDAVRAHCICPTFVADSESVKRLGDTARSRYEKAARKAGLGLPGPKDIAALALFLCSDDAAKLTGQILSVNGGINA